MLYGIPPGGAKENFTVVVSYEQIKAQVFLYLNQYDNGNLIVSIFSGLWLFPFGYLVYKSGFLPKVLGVLLMLDCFSYLINFLGNSLIDNYSNIGIASFVQLPASFGEICICLWLLIMGVKGKLAMKLSSNNVKWQLSREKYMLRIDKRNGFDINFWNVKQGLKKLIWYWIPKILYFCS